MNINKIPQRLPKKQFWDWKNTNIKWTFYKWEYKPMKDIVLDVIQNELIPNKMDIKIETIFDFIKGNIKEDFEVKTLHFNLWKLVKKWELSRRFPWVYEIRTNDSYSILLKWDWRDLSFIEEEVLDWIYYDHAWNDWANKDPWIRKEDWFTQFKLMADFPTFQMEQKDMDELHRVLKKWRFCVLNLPKEWAENQEYLEKMNEITKFAWKQKNLNLIINLFNEWEKQIIKDFWVNKLEDLKWMLWKMKAFKSFIWEEKYEKFQKEFNKKLEWNHYKELEKKYNDAWFQIYAKIDWNKNTPINQWRVVKDREQLWFLTKWRARDDLRSNNKTRMKALDIIIESDHMIHSIFSNWKQNNKNWYDESWINIINDIKKVNKDNRTKKRELLEDLIKHNVLNDYFDFFQKLELELWENWVKKEFWKDYLDFKKLYSTINATMMWANWILQSEYKINKPKKWDIDYFWYSTEKPLKLQEIIIQFILMKWETMLEPATWWWSMMEAAINQWVNYIGIDISEDSINTCIDRLKLKYKDINELLKEMDIDSEEELKIKIKDILENYNSWIKDKFLFDFNYQEKIYYPKEKIDNFIKLLVSRGFDENNIKIDEFTNIVIWESEWKIVYGWNIYPYRDEILEKNKNWKYFKNWECIVFEK